MNYAKIEEKRKETGITVKKLCEDAGICRDEYYKILRGDRSPKFEIVASICRVLDLNMNELV